MCKGVLTWRNWIDGSWLGENFDLWDMLALGLSTRSSNVCVPCVKGHAKQVGIDRGRATWEDKAGDNWADSLAVDGARSREVCPEVTADTSLSKLGAKQAQGICCGF